MVIGAVRAAFARILSSPGIEAVWRLRQMYPNKWQIINALGVRFPNLTGAERQVLFDVGTSAANAAQQLENLGPQSGFPLDEIPVNEYLGVDPDVLNRGRVAVSIEANIPGMPRQGLWQFYADTGLGETWGEFQQAIEGRAQNIIATEVAYYEGATIPPNTELEITVKWTARMF